MRIFFWHTVLLGADAFLIDGSLECKFLAYFGTMLLTVAVAVRGGIRLLLHIMPTDPLLKGVHVYMTSPLHCALTIPARGSQKCQDFSQLFFKAFYVMKSSHEWGFSHQHISCWGRQHWPAGRQGLLNLKCEMLYGFYELVKHLQFFTPLKV